MLEGAFGGDRYWYTDLARTTRRRARPERDRTYLQKSALHAQVLAPAGVAQKEEHSFPDSPPRRGRCHGSTSSPLTATLNSLLPCPTRRLANGLKPIVRATIKPRNASPFGVIGASYPLAQKPDLIVGKHAEEFTGHRIGRQLELDNFAYGPPKHAGPRGRPHTCCQ